VGGVFVLTTLSTIIQRAFFKWMVAWKGREAAKRIRFFYRAPYHHHLQAIWHFSEEKRAVTSVWERILVRLGVQRPGVEDQLLRQEDVNNRVIWRIHTLSVWLFVLGLIIYFKVR
jgi:UDP-N-acetylmuramyl pentapeptide phosphotransferase/UDP-N-acetylglucosamine-1-phosphate transferase